MKWLRFIIACLSLLVILVGCRENDAENGYKTKEKAIQYGLLQEDVNETAVLSIGEYEGETFVFFEKDGALGVASLTKIRNGYSWFRRSLISALRHEAFLIQLQVLTIKLSLT
ncbi:hypothetical protein [Ureibacillus aquaedulcis]|uniref:Uncharacterized protein n=1 Tax=Ureibacillus aquaedulcis TaxID=3058421 RepID=A0ABT8GN40_9BACL|nr:hypothetical protein [Ureibacillus sp. BA0131]MDN4492833.1 hypothetical protein [Ureibacillus sp. BA0131]